MSPNSIAQRFSKGAFRPTENGAGSRSRTYSGTDRRVHAKNLGVREPEKYLVFLREPWRQRGRQQVHPGNTVTCGKGSEPGMNTGGSQVSTLVPNVTGAGTGTDTVLVGLKTVNVKMNCNKQTDYLLLWSRQKKAY